MMYRRRVIPLWLYRGARITSLHLAPIGRIGSRSTIGTTGGDLVGCRHTHARGVCKKITHPQDPTGKKDYVAAIGKESGKTKQREIRGTHLKAPE